MRNMESNLKEEQRMSDVLKAMEERRSIRKYKADMVPQEIIDKIIEAGLYAASGKGTQNTIIIQVTNKELRDKISEMNCKIGGWEEGFDPFYGAPAMLIVLAKKDWPTGIYDGSLVMGNLMLAAHDLGIGSCWIHRAKEPCICRNSIYPMRNKYKSTFGKKIGDMYLADIRNIHIQKTLKELSDEGKAPSTLREALGRVRECLESAKNNRYI